MISSKNFLIYGLLCLAACSSPKKETTEVADSTKTDSVVIEEPETAYTEEGRILLLIVRYLNTSPSLERMNR
jgi:hypothetical protein